MPQNEFIKNLANSFSATFLNLSMKDGFEKLPLDLFIRQWAKKLFGEGKIGKIGQKMMFYLISCLWLSFGRLRVRISLLGQNCTTSAYIKTILLNFLLTKLKKNWTGPTSRDHCTMHNDSNRAVLKGVSNANQILNVFLSQSMSQLKKGCTDWTPLGR